VSGANQFTPVPDWRKIAPAGHEMTIVAAPLASVYVSCACGWFGEVRDRERTAERDALKHARVAAYVRSTKAAKS
jgi:hypothetical protein